MINIKGLDKAKVLKALYDASHVQGMGFLQAVPDGTVTVPHCRELLLKQLQIWTYFHYIHQSSRFSLCLHSQTAVRSLYYFHVLPVNPAALPQRLFSASALP